jgi:hypothetical protein
MNFAFPNGIPRLQSVHCGPPDTSVDLSTPTPDTDIARALALATTLLERSQLIESMHALVREHKNTCSWQIKCTRFDGQGGNWEFPAQTK